MDPREANLLRSITETTWRFYLWIGCLLVVLAWGLFAYIQQVRYGLIVTGMRDQISWGLYITNFVFFIGISHAGTLISAILRVTDTGWRRPITRMAEAVTVFALCIGAPMVIIDMGRPDRMLNIFRYGRIQSPIIWDVLGVTTYLTGCLIYFYIPMIPDLALLSSHPRLAAWRRRLYRGLSLGWTGTPEQKQLLERAISCMAVFIIPLAVSVHTVVSWIFAMTLRPGWNSSIFGPYFVVGAIYSGAAAVIFSMWVLRRVYHLEDYIEPKHFRNLGWLLLAFSLLYLYFNVNEYLTAGYKLEGAERVLLDRLFTGNFASLFWGAQSVCVLFPLLLMIAVLGMKRYRQFTIPGVVTASALVIVGAWLKRYIIIVPTLRSPFLPTGQRLPWQWTHYRPTWVEWSITAGAVAGFLLIYSLLSKLFPIISIWETREQEEPAAEPQAAMAESGPRWWRPGTAVPLLVAAGLLFYSTPARASAAKPKQLKRVTISLEAKALPRQPATPQEGPSTSALPSPPDTGRIYLFAGHVLDPLRLFSSNATREEERSTPFAVVAALKDGSGAPLSFKPVQFFLKTGFGALSFGSRPTLADGKAQLRIDSRRLGTYPVEVVFKGDDEFAPAEISIPVDFGPRPTPALPHVGVLITPYATSSITVPFLVFYGTMWITFVYVMGYLIVWRMRRCRSTK